MSRHGAAFLLVGCSHRAVWPTPSNIAVPIDAAVAQPITRYDPSWGNCVMEREAPFGPEATIELVDCTLDPGRPDGEPRPTDYTARLAVRRDGTIEASGEIGTFTKWEEGRSYQLSGVVESPDGAPAVLTTYFSGSMGYERGSTTLTVYAREAASFASVFDVTATSVDIAVAADRTLAKITLCNGGCDYQSSDPSTTETFELRFDGKAVTKRATP